MSADERLLRLVQLSRRDGLNDAVAADALLGELSREWREMTERIAELETALRPLAGLEDMTTHSIRAARRALSGEGDAP